MEFKTVHGVIAATVTPFDQNGHVNLEALDQLTDFLISKGIHGLFPCGSTGEGVLLDLDERKSVALRTIKRAAGRVPVLVHTGALRPADAIELTLHARDIGATGASLIPPYYYGMDQSCLYEYYRSVAEAAPDFPIYIYNIPSNVKNIVSAELLAKLTSKFPNIVGAKESSMDFMNFIDYIQAARPGLCALMGNDAQIYSALAIGGSGAIAATSTAFPEAVVAIYDLWKRGDHAKALEAQSTVIKLRAIFRSFPAIAPYKKVLEWRGIKVGTPRLPLRDLTAAEEERLRNSLNQIGFEELLAEKSVTC